MSDVLKRLFSVILGCLAAFWGEYGLFLILVAVAVVLDVITGIVKAKATGEGLSSEKARKGFWRKITLFVALGFGIFLDYAAEKVIISTGITLSIGMPFALIVSAYIIINESISIFENLYLANPEAFPPSVGRILKVAKNKIEEDGVDDGRKNKN